MMFFEATSPEDRVGLVRGDCLLVVALPTAAAISLSIDRSLYFHILDGSHGQLPSDVCRYHVTSTPQRQLTWPAPQNLGW